MKPGTFVDAIPNSVGCDSIITINLNLIYQDSTINATICHGSDFVLGDVHYLSPGTYFDTLNYDGCDFIVELNLNVIEPFSFWQVTVCEGDEYVFGSNVLTTPGLYIDTFPSVTGCDSLVYLELLHQPQPTLQITTEGALVAPLADAYTWIDCNGNPIPDQPGMIFTPLEKGNFAVIITKGVCVDTSDCIPYFYESNYENTRRPPSIYPNPVKSSVRIHFEAPEASMDLINIDGKILLRGILQNDESIDLSSFAKGIYIIRLSTADWSLINRF